MTLDHYAPCPCGSGKKFKFCKCVDQPQEYEKIIRLMEGGQELAALDRINQLLSKSPSSAWLLALKGELTLNMQEFEAFRETAVRFLKLKPDNPLALVMRSIAATMFGETLDSSVRFLLDGLAESREALPSLTLPALQILSTSLDRVGFGALSGYWDDLYDSLQQSSEAEYEPVRRDSAKNLLVRSPAKIIEDQGAMPWTERLNEVRSLTRVFRFALAETKLRSILRDYPDHAGPLSHLLRAQMVLLEQDGAVATARKLASLNELIPTDRDYFLALAMELEAKQESLTNPSVTKFCEIESDEQVGSRLRELDFIEAVDEQASSEIRRFYALTIRDEVPAKSLFHVFYRSSTDSTSNDASLRRMVGTVVLFGKQTDRPARALLIAYRFPAYEDCIGRVIGAMEAIRDIDDPSAPRRYQYGEFLQRASFTVDADGKTTPLSIPRASELFIDDFLSMPMGVLGGQSPLQAVEDESKRATVRALLTHFEALQTVVVEARAIDDVYQQLQLERPRVSFDSSAEGLRLNNVLDLVRVDVRSLNDKQLRGLLSTAISMESIRLIWQCSQEALTRESLANDEPVKASALSAMMLAATSVDEKLDLAAKLQGSLTKLSKPIGQILLQRVNMLASLGRDSEAQQILQDGFRENPNDPYLLSFFQYISQNQGGMGSMSEDQAVMNEQMLMQRMRVKQETGAAASQSPSRPESGSGLMLPGEPAASGGQTKSKLWLPGS